MIGALPGGTIGFGCDRCGAVAQADGLPAQFGSLEELSVVAVRDGWLGEGQHPEHSPVICPPCRAGR